MRPRHGANVAPPGRGQIEGEHQMTEVLAGLSSRAIASGLGVLLLVACSTGGSTQQSASSTDVTQWVAWGGQELTPYRDVLKPFESKTGTKVHVTTNAEPTTATANASKPGTQLPA